MSEQTNEKMVKVELTSFEALHLIQCLKTLLSINRAALQRAKNKDEISFISSTITVRQHIIEKLGG